MIFEHQGECPFCHAQLILTMTTPDPSSEEITEEAAEVCTCTGAREWRGMRYTEKAITNVLGEESGNNGFDYIVPTDVLEPIREICRAMINDRIIGGVTFKIPGGDAVRMVKNGGAVKIRRTAKKQIEM